MEAANQYFQRGVTLLNLHRPHIVRSHIKAREDLEVFGDAFPAGAVLESTAGKVSATARTCIANINVDAHLSAEVLGHGQRIAIREGRGVIPAKAEYGHDRACALLGNLGARGRGRGAGRGQRAGGLLGMAL